VAADLALTNRRTRPRRTTTVTSRRILTALAVGVPPLVLAAVGVTHPSELNADTAGYWRDLHIGILAVFPLLGFAPWLIVRGRALWLSWAAGILGFVYAAFYSALDILAGIGSGGLEHAGHHDAIGVTFALGDGIGLVGSVAYVAACLLAGGFAVRMSGLRALPFSVLVAVGSAMFLAEHIFFPWGVIGQVALAVGWVGLAFSLRAVAPVRDIDGGSR
jgi:hypothetical protein